VRAKISSTASEPLGHEIDADDEARAAVQRDPYAHLPDRPEAEDGEAPTLGYIRVGDRLPRRGQDVGQIQEAFVGRPLGHLDRAEVRHRHAQVLRLAARDLAVKLGVAEEGGPLSMLAYLRRLALRVEAAVAHEATAAGDVERDDDAVARLHVLDSRAHFLDDAHRLVAEDVAGLEERPHHLVQMKVGPADAARGDADDCIRRLLELRVGDALHANVPPTVPDKCSHSRLRASATPATCRETREGRTGCFAR
jgi:hypothetical protein